MTFLEALYGSQYYEISQKGRDGNKGRLNGNLFLSAFIIIVILLGFAVLFKLVSSLEASVNNTLSNIFISGKAAGKIIGLPLIGIIYFIVSRTLGSEENFKRYVDSFMQYPDEQKEKATMKILVPFFIVLGLLFLMVII